METTTKKIAIACFIGGVLCCLVALAVSPVHWWLGLLAGLAGGYLGYEFREVLRAIPIAWRKTKESVSEWRRYWLEKAGKVKAFLAEPHPFIYLGIFLSALSTISFILMTPAKTNPVPVPVTAIAVFAYCFWFLFGGFLSTTIFCLIATEGAESLNRFWNKDSLDLRISTIAYASCINRGLVEEPLTYLNAYRWLTIGLWLIFLHAARNIGRAIIRWTWIVLRAIGLFFWYLFKLIHSEKRVLCAIDGTLGGAIAYAWLHAPAMPFAGQIALIFFGGLIGATLGVIDWEIISKRILHVAGETSN